MIIDDLKVLDQSYRHGNLYIGSMVLCLSVMVVMVMLVGVVVMVTVMPVGMGMAVVRGLMVESVVESVKVGFLED